MNPKLDIEKRVKSLTHTNTGFLLLLRQCQFILRVLFRTIEDIEYVGESMLSITKVKKGGRVLIAQLLRATKFSLRLPGNPVNEALAFPSLYSPLASDRYRQQI